MSAWELSGHTEHSQSCWEEIPSGLQAQIRSVASSATFPEDHTLRVFLDPSVDTVQQNLGGHSWQLGELEAKLKGLSAKRSGDL